VEILIPAGQDADVGTPLCRYEDGGASEAAPVVETPVLPVEVARAPVEPIPAHYDSRVRATPLARAVARRNGVDLDTVVGTGRRGRIEAADVRGAVVNDADGPSVAVAGGRIAYRVWGTARPGVASVVLLHGFGGDASTWVGLATILARGGSHVVAPDLPGHGRTSLAADGFDAVADAVGGFLEAMGLTGCELVGHSLGGAVAARVARAHPERVARVTLIAPAGLDRGIDVSFIRDLARARSGGAVAHLTRRLAVRPPMLSPAQLDAMAGELARGRLLPLADAMVDDGGQCVDSAGDLRALTVPARVIWGLQDRIIPWTQATQAGSRVALHFVPDAGHVPHWDQPNEIAALLA
jgi:pyruvate dehydrogenase E2 component (dihydrolipoamide acetyltransferase)